MSPHPEASLGRSSRSVFGSRADGPSRSHACTLSRIDAVLLGVEHRRVFESELGFHLRAERIAIQLRIAAAGVVRGVSGRSAPIVDSALRERARHGKATGFQKLVGSLSILNPVDEVAEPRLGLVAHAEHAEEAI